MFSWLAVYDDGRRVSQYPAGGELSAEHLSRNGLMTFSLLGGDGVPLVQMNLFTGAKLLYRRRHRLTLGRPVETCHVLSSSSGGEFDQAWFAFEASGDLLLARFEQGHEWFYPVCPIPADDLIVT